MRASPSPSAMALPFGKLAILVGAGVVGSVLAKEGGLSSVSDIFSGAFKLVLKGIKQNEPTKSMKKPHNDFLMAQATKSQLSSRMDSLDNNLDEIAQFTASTKETDTTSKGVLHLCNFVSTLSLNEPAERIQDLPATSRGTPEAAPVTPSRINSLPPRGLLHELPESFNSSGHCQERDEDSSGTESSAMNGAGTQESMKGGQSLSYGLLSRRLTGINTSHLLTSSLGSTVLHRVRSSTQQS
ncbi:hypothetical protein SAY86_026454 [Trapa natans]|uniref:Uncharacterized protein n=1 Tax=Trapa natans TaxID=22666 RepID=A0AAN7QEW7_TRANT|nr:hypothetical protein SAY86_026454 [Trapa natans]